jgi:hypothetical protein
MEQIRNFIDLVGQGDNVGAKDALSELLASRAFESLESKKQGIAGTLFNTEEVEQIDELSITPAARKQSKERENQYHDDEEFPIRRNQDLSGKSLVDLKVAHRHHSETGGNADVADPEEKARWHNSAKSLRRIEKHVEKVYGKRAANNLNQRRYGFRHNEEVEQMEEDFTNKKYSFDAKPYAHLDQRDTGGSVHHTHPEYFVRTSANQHLAKHIEKAKTHKDASTQRIANSSHTELKRRVADGSAPEKYKAHLKEEVEQ